MTRCLGSLAYAMEDAAAHPVVASFDSFSAIIGVLGTLVLALFGGRSNCAADQGWTRHEKA